MIVFMWLSRHSILPFESFGPVSLQAIPFFRFLHAYLAFLASPAGQDVSLPDVNATSLAFMAF